MLLMLVMGYLSDETYVCVIKSQIYRFGVGENR